MNISLSYVGTIPVSNGDIALWSNLVGHVIIMIFKKFPYTVSIYSLVRRKCTYDQLMSFEFPKLDLWYKNEHNFPTVGPILEIQRAK